MHTIISKLLAALLIVAVSGVASAGLPGLDKLTGGSGSGSSSVSSDQIVKKYVGGQKSVLKADAKMLAAVGLKDQAAKAELQAKNLTEGATTGALEDAAQVQTESSKALSDKMSGEKVVMDEESKKQFSAGMADLGKGIAQYVGMSADAKGFKPNAAALNGSTASAAYVVKSLPGSISALGATLKKAIEFSKANDIAVPKEATDATSLL